MPSIFEDYMKAPPSIVTNPDLVHDHSHGSSLIWDIEKYASCQVHVITFVVALVSFIVTVAVVFHSTPNSISGAVTQSTWIPCILAA